MYKIAKLLSDSALLELTGTRHTIMISFKYPIDGDIILSIDKYELLTLGVYIGKYLIEHDKSNSFYRRNLSSKKNPTCYLYGFSIDALIIIKNDEIISMKPISMLYNASIILQLTHADCQRAGIAIGRTQKIKNLTFSEYNKPYLLFD
jgi:hypothetical protein